MPVVQRFVVAVAGVLFDGSGRVLLIREKEGAQQYGLPGGLVQEYETPQETLLRQIELQAGVTASVGDVVAVRHRPGEPQSLLLVGYRCRLLSGVPRLTGEADIAEVGWHSTRDLPRPMADIVVPVIEAAARGVGTFVFDEPAARPKRSRLLSRRGR